MLAWSPSYTSVGYQGNREGDIVCAHFHFLDWCHYWTALEKPCRLGMFAVSSVAGSDQSIWLGVTKYLELPLAVAEELAIQVISLSLL